MLHDKSYNPEACQHSVQRIGGYAPRFQAFFLALGFPRFHGESRPTHLPLTPAVRHLQWNWSFLLYNLVMTKGVSYVHAELGLARYIV